MMPLIWCFILLPPPALFQTSVPCVDQSPSCGMWASRGVCDTHSRVRVYTCPVSCGSCHASSSPLTPLPTVDSHPMVAGRPPLPVDLFPQSLFPASVDSSPSLAGRPSLPVDRRPPPSFPASVDSSPSLAGRPSLPVDRRPPPSFPASVDSSPSLAGRPSLPVDRRPPPSFPTSVDSSPSLAGRPSLPVDRRPPPPRPSPVVPLPPPPGRRYECGRPVTPGNDVFSNSFRRMKRQTNPRSPAPQTPSRVSATPPSPSGVVPSSPQNHVHCGATVISDRFLITSAYCVIDPHHPIRSVTLGDRDLSRQDESNARPATYDIKQIFVHPDFDPTSGSRYNDVALLETVDKIVFNEYVFPYCLVPSQLPKGTLVTGAGFGRVNDTHAATTLQEAQLRVMSLDQCEDTYQQAGQMGTLRAAYPSLLQGRDVLCAGYPGRGACKGDEGGPLFYEDEEGRRYLTGIISLTGACSGRHDIMPGVYTSIAHHIHFIYHVMGENQGT